jgi:hypothetical protein
MKQDTSYEPIAMVSDIGNFVNQFLSRHPLGGNRRETIWMLQNTKLIFRILQIFFKIATIF